MGELPCISLPPYCRLPMFSCSFFISFFLFPRSSSFSHHISHSFPISLHSFSSCFLLFSYLFSFLLFSLFFLLSSYHLAFLFLDTLLSYSTLLVIFFFIFFFFFFFFLPSSLSLIPSLIHVPFLNTLLSFTSFPFF